MFFKSCGWDRITVELDTTLTAWMNTVPSGTTAPNTGPWIPRANNVRTVTPRLDWNEGTKQHKLRVKEPQQSKLPSHWWKRWTCQKWSGAAPNQWLADTWWIKVRETLLVKLGAIGAPPPQLAASEPDQWPKTLAKQACTVNSQSESETW